METSKELVAKIERSFRNVPYPGRKIGDKEELREFVGKKRAEVTINDLNRNQALIFFSVPGLLYYLPVYLISILEHPNEVANTVRQGVIRDLGYHQIKYVMGKDKLCWHFTADQRAAILEFLENYPQFFPGDLLQNRQRANFYAPELDFNLLLREAITFWRDC